VWVRAAGDELVIVADLNTLPIRPSWAPAPPAGLIEVARHQLSTPGRPRIELAHYPGHPQDPSGAPRPPTPKPTRPEETAFLALGPGAEAWLVEAAAAGAARVRAKMAAAVELAALVSPGQVDAALGISAAAGRFAEDDLLATAPPRHRRPLRGPGRGRRNTLRPARHRRLGGVRPMSTPEFSPHDLPPSPWILLDRTTIKQTAAVLHVLGEWLAGADPSITEPCARACSAGDTDALAMSAYLDALAARLSDRLEEVDSWS
jgi:hypothetical protein